MNTVYEQEVIVKNKLGIHARPAAMIANIAGKNDASLTIVHEGNEIDCRSVLSILMLAAGHGTKLTLRATGSEAKICFDEVVKIFAENFNEE